MEPITIRTYAELTEYAKNFAKGSFGLLAILSNPGLLKSRTFEKVMTGQNHLMVSGHSTALIVYEQLFLHIDELVVIDDADTLYKDSRARPLLINLCETRPVKTLRWNTRARLNAPMEFTTKSKVCILANEFKATTNNLQAIMSRGIFLYFDPSTAECHRQAKSWCDPVVWDFVGEQLHLLAQPDLRLYTKIADLKNAGMKWEDTAITMLCPSHERLALDLARNLLRSKDMTTEAARVKAFTQQTGLSRATYYRYAAIVKESGKCET